jgi:nucleotide-binding universal stress UspA family protein
MSAFTPVLERVKPKLSFRHILHATDFSEASEKALHFALTIAHRRGAELLIVHALPPLSEGNVPLDPLPRELDRPLLEAEEQMEQLGEFRELQGVSYRTHIAHGRVWEVLSAEMQREKTDLLVVGTHGRSSLQKLAIGSVAEEVLRSADCPVLTIGPRVESTEETWALHTILVATDFGPASAKALQYAISLAQEYESRLVLVHMVPPMPLADAAYAPAVFAADDLLQWREAIRRESEKKLKALIPPGTLAKQPLYVVGMDFLPEGILCAAADHAADLIVMGANRGTSPRIASHIPWALTHHVICEARCPVLTVRGPAN